MKFIKYFIMITFASFIGIEVVFAAPTFSTSVSSSTIEKGANVTFSVTIRNTASWSITLSGYGSTSSCSKSFSDSTSDGNNTTKTFSVTCKGSDIGLISFSVSGDATQKAQPNSTAKVTGNNRVNVTAVKPKSTNNYLKSIKIGDYVLDPVFNKETLEYSIKVPSTTNSINIEASPEDGTASVNGANEFDVNEGINTFEIKVNAQNGDERIYKINVIVEDLNPIKVIMNGKEYTILKNSKGLIKPELYEEKMIKISDFDVPSFYSEITNFTLVALKDGEGKVVWSIYDEEKNSYVFYQEIKANGLMLYIIDSENDLTGFLKSSITFDGNKYIAFKTSETSDFSIVYAINVATGDKDYYVYDAKQNTFQRYDNEMIDLLREENDKFKLVLIGFASLSIFLLILVIILAFRKPNKKLRHKMEALEKQLRNPMDTIKVESVSKTEKKSKKTDDKKNKKEEKNQEESDNLSKTEALKNLDDVTKMIEEHEKTVSINKAILEKEKSKISEEETMYDIFESSKKKKKK